MMGDRDFRSVIKNAIDSIGNELDIKIDAKDNNTIHVDEVVRCLRRSYYDRTDPLEIKRRRFNELVGGLLQNYGYGSKPAEFDIDDIKLKGRADMIVDGVIILFRSSDTIRNDPHASDVLFLNACLWMYDKLDGVIVYISGDMQESSFSITRDKKMFEEVIRRIKVLNDLLKEQKIPILEPSAQCEGCQYYQRCYMKEKVGKSFDLKEMLGLEK